MFKKTLLFLMSIMMVAMPSALADEGAFGADITVSELYPAVGGEVTATVTVGGDTELQLSNSYIAYHDGVAETTVLSDVFTESIAAGETASASCTVTVSALPSDIIFYANDDEAARYTIEACELYEFADVISAEATGDDETKLYYTVSGLLNNTGNADGENIVLEFCEGETVIFTEIVSLIAAKTGYTFAIAAEIAKSDFNCSEKTFTLNAKDGETVVATETVTLTNQFFITDVTVNSGNNITMVVGDTLVPDVAFTPSTSVCAYTLASDSEAVTVGNDNISLTAAAVGTATVTLTAGIFTKTFEINVIRATEATDITNVRACYTDENGDEQELALSTPFRYDFYGPYRITVPSGVSSIYLEAALPQGMNVAYEKASDEKSVSINDLSNINTTYSGGYYMVKIIIRNPADSNDIKTYTFSTNNTPVISSDFPAEIKTFAGLETAMELTRYYSDIEDAKRINKFEAKNRNTGEILGRLIYDNIENKHYWAYTDDAEDGETPVIFTFTDRLDGSVTVESVLKAGIDTEAPVWPSNTEPSATSITKSSAKITWQRATDNDMISHYLVHYYAKTTETKYVKVTPDSGSANVTLSSLNKDTEYTVYIEAYDRSENYVTSKKIKFTTKKGTSDTTSIGSGSTGSTVGSSTPVYIPKPAAPSFSDLEGYDWAKSEISDLAVKGIIKGTTDITFSPSSNIKRGDFIILLVRALGLHSYNTEGFADVPSDSYYAEAIGVAKALGVVNGKYDGTFSPDESITRQDMLVMVQRSLEAKSKKFPASYSYLFTDDEKIADYAYEAVYSLSSCGIVKGDTEGNVNPTDFTTRAEAAVIIHRLLAV